MAIGDYVGKYKQYRLMEGDFGSCEGCCFDINGICHAHKRKVYISCSSLDREDGKSIVFINGDNNEKS